MEVSRLCFALLRNSIWSRALHRIQNLYAIHLDCDSVNCNEPKVNRTRDFIHHAMITELHYLLVTLDKVLQWSYTKLHLHERFWWSQQSIIYKSSVMYPIELERELEELTDSYIIARPVRSSFTSHKSYLQHRPTSWVLPDLQLFKSKIVPW